MTLADLITSVRFRSGKHDQSEIRMALNQAAQRVSVEIEQPTKTDILEVSSGVFSLPPYAYPALIQSFTLADGSVSFTAMTVQEAGTLYPDWRTSDSVFARGENLIIYDPGNYDQTLTVYPAPDVGGQGAYRMTYVWKSPPMEKPNDQPWGGLMPEYHHILVNYALFILTGNANEYAMYKKELVEASALYQNELILPKNVFGLGRPFGRFGR